MTRRGQGAVTAVAAGELRGVPARRRGCPSRPRPGPAPPSLVRVAPRPAAASASHLAGRRFRCAKTAAGQSRRWPLRGPFGPGGTRGCAAWSSADPSRPGDPPSRNGGRRPSASGRRAGAPLPPAAGRMCETRRAAPPPPRRASCAADRRSQPSPAFLRVEWRAAIAEHAPRRRMVRGGLLAGKPEASCRGNLPRQRECTNIRAPFGVRDDRLAMALMRPKSSKGS